MYRKFFTFQKQFRGLDYESSSPKQQVLNGKEQGLRHPQHSNMQDSIRNKNMEMATGNKYVTKHVLNIPPQYKPLEEWEETLEELARNDALYDDHCLPELPNQVKKELGKATQVFHQTPTQHVMHQLFSTSTPILDEVNGR